MTNLFYGMFNSSDGDGLSDKERAENERRGREEVILAKAERLDSGTTTAPFAATHDFPDPNICCVELMGDEAVEAWVEAQERMNAKRSSAEVADFLLSNVGELEIIDGAAAESGDVPADVTYDPWGSVRRK